MDQIVSILNSAQDLMKIQFTLYGFTLSYWDVMIYGMIAAIVGGLIVKFFLD